MNKKTKTAVSIIFVVWLTLLLATTAYAVTVTIDTNNAVVDTNWDSVTVLRDDPNDDASSTDRDIDKVWITNEADYSKYYFRLDYVGTPDIDYIPLVKLDCNQNGSYTDSVDVLVHYDHFGDLTSECKGNSNCFKVSNVDDDNGASAGEKVNTVTMEWYGSIAGDSIGNEVDFAACKGAINVRFEIVYFNDFSIVTDFTEVRAYNVPTVVSLTKFSSKSQASWYMPLGVFAAGLLGLVFAGGAMVLRKKNSK